MIKEIFTIILDGIMLLTLGLAFIMLANELPDIIFDVINNPFGIILVPLMMFALISLVSFFILVDTQQCGLKDALKISFGAGAIFTALFMTFIMPAGLINHTVGYSGVESILENMSSLRGGV